MQTQPTAINTAKILMIACLIGFAVVFRIQDVQIMVEKYAEYADHQQFSRRLTPFIW